MNQVVIDTLKSLSSLLAKKFPGKVNAIEPLIMCLPGNSQDDLSYYIQLMAEVPSGNKVGIFTTVFSVGQVHFTQGTVNIRCNPDSPRREDIKAVAKELSIKFG